MEQILKDLEKKMQDAFDALLRQFSKTRTGRANVAALEDVRIDYYGQNTPIKQLCNIKNVSELQEMDKEERDSCLKQLKEEFNLSIRQIERVTGINRGIIFKA